MRRLRAKYERYGYAPVGLVTNLKFIVNRSLWKLFSRARAGYNKKAKKVLGWFPKYTLKQGLRETIEHWRKVFSQNLDR